MFEKQLDPVVRLQKLHANDLIAGPAVKHLIESLCVKESMRLGVTTGTQEFIVLCCELYAALSDLAQTNDEWNEYLNDASVRMRKRVQSLNLSHG